jgi:hypothetical protein
MWAMWAMCVMWGARGMWGTRGDTGGWTNAPGETHKLSMTIMGEREKIIQTKSAPVIINSAHRKYR